MGPLNSSKWLTGQRWRRNLDPGGPPRSRHVCTYGASPSTAWGALVLPVLPATPYAPRAVRSSAGGGGGRAIVLCSKSLKMVNRCT